MRKRHQRLAWVAAAGMTLALAAGLSLIALRDTVVFFYSPSEVVAEPPPLGVEARVGGLVAEGSIGRDEDGAWRFHVTDSAESLEVRFEGEPPALFGEGQGVVAQGVFESASLFRASRILAKHDEQYMPPEVAAALKASGQWRGDGA